MTTRLPPKAFYERLVEQIKAYWLNKDPDSYRDLMIQVVKHPKYAGRYMIDSNMVNGYPPTPKYKTAMSMGKRHDLH